MPNSVAAPSMAVEACARMVEAAKGASCAAPAAPAFSPAIPATPPPEWDALANSLASIGLAVAWGGTVLAIIALIAGIAWAKLLRNAAREVAKAEAAKEASECADKHMKIWLAEVAPQIISKHMQNIQDASLGDDDDRKAADAMGKGA